MAEKWFRAYTPRAGLRPHGTIAAYRRHYRHGEKVCEACLREHMRRKSERKARNRKGVNPA